ncbi:hypothetical protein QYF61_011217 [Mycteria americana]|uniref:Uncharacterized protein n=1 Tax=Mycteria americana TaxID=33587 RepID=A0AAN7NG64_MYCAM|nr:hypothetical protein QYF61_011217 [Mycteria americana]
MERSARRQCQELHSTTHWEDKGLKLKQEAHAGYKETLPHEDSQAPDQVTRSSVSVCPLPADPSAQQPLAAKRSHRVWVRWFFNERRNYHN